MSGTVKPPDAYGSVNVSRLILACLPARINLTRLVRILLKIEVGGVLGCS